MKKLICFVLCLFVFTGYALAKEPDYQEKGDLGLADNEYGLGLDLILAKWNDGKVTLKTESKIDFANENTTGNYNLSNYLVVQVDLSGK